MLKKALNYHSNFLDITCLTGEAVSLAQLLDEKEQRQLRQQQYLQQSSTVISYTLVSPGAVKNNQLWQYVFKRGLVSIRQLLAKLQITTIVFQQYNSIAGQHAIWTLNTNAALLKQQLIKLEESMPIARLWDVDVVTTQGILTRNNYNTSQRKCLICTDAAKICAKLGKHQLTDLLHKIQQIVIDDEFALNLSEHVYQALIEEVEFTPKPGLVDLADNGAHADMDINTFYQSASVLKPYFYTFAYTGMLSSQKTLAELFQQLRAIGLQAEREMLRVTKQINTHKGAIFSFGLICGAIGYLYAKQQTITILQICNIIQFLTKGITQELALDGVQQSNGYQVYLQYAYTGARGEAESGFASVREVGFLTTDTKLAPTHRKLVVLTRLLAQNNDTNVLNRGGLQSLIWLQNYATSILSNPYIYQNQQNLTTKLSELNQQCIQKNISPGGSADLFATILFFYSYFNI